MQSKYINVSTQLEENLYLITSEDFPVYLFYRTKIKTKDWGALGERSQISAEGDISIPEVRKFLEKCFGNCFVRFRRDKNLLFIYFSEEQDLLNFKLSFEGG